MRVLYFENSGATVFDLSSDLLREIFELVRGADDNSNFYAYAKLLFFRYMEDVEIVEGDHNIVPKSYAMLVNGLGNAPPMVMNLVQHAITTDCNGHDHLIVGEICTEDEDGHHIHGFYLNAMNEEQFAEQSAIHLAMFRAEQRGVIGHT